MEEEVIEDPSLLCRVCLNTGSYHLATVILVEVEKVIIEDMLKEFSSLQINESLPSMVCSNCLSHLVDCYAFLKKVQRADDYIKQLFDPEQQDCVEQTMQVADMHAAEDNNAAASITREETDLENLEYIFSDDYAEVRESSPNDASSENLRGRKRVARGSKKPMIVLTENVSNILSRVRQSSVDDLIEELTEEHLLEGEPPLKRAKSSENSSYVVTKFILQPYNGVDKGSSSSGDMKISKNMTGGCDYPVRDSNGVLNHIQTMDMTVVEVDSSSKISNQEIDDDTNIEDPNKIYMCKYCPKAFSTSHHLLMHSRKSHICHFCTQSFVKVEDLHRHSREVHTSFKCTLCEKEFSNNSNLRNHIKRVHNIDLPAFVSLLSVKKKSSSKYSSCIE